MHSEVLDVHMCSCDYMLELTYCKMFSQLDQALVSAALKLCQVQQAQLYIGAYEDAPDTCQILASLSQPSAPQLAPVKRKIMPVQLYSGQRFSLVIDQYDELDESLLVEMSQLLAVYCNQHEHLNRANKDRLTNLKNRRAFDLEYNELATSCIDAESDANKRHILAVLDIDHFKQVNDNYGHLIGDETLIAISNIMKDFFQREDPLYRFGGEEFIVLMHCSSPKAAYTQLEALRQRIAGTVFPQISKLTVSIGMVELAPGIDKNLLFERADAALYQAKDDGRNCVKIYEKLVADKIIPEVTLREGDVELF